MSLTVVTVILYAASIYLRDSFPTDQQLKIGGLNETEMLDLKKLSPTFPANSEVENYGAWSVNFNFSRIEDGTNQFLAIPPVHLVAPFLSRIKSFGYKITFYNSFVDEVRYRPSSPTDIYQMMPLLSYTWILEKELEQTPIDQPSLNPALPPLVPYSTPKIPDSPTK